MRKTTSNDCFLLLFLRRIHKDLYKELPPKKKVTVAKTYYVVTTFVTSFESLFGYLKKTLFFCQRSQSLKVLSNCTFRSSFLGRHYVCMMKLMSRNSLSQKPLDHHKGVTFSDDDSKKIPKEHTPKGTYPKYP